MKNFFFVKKITKKLFSKASIMGSSKWTYVKIKNWVVISLHSMKIEDVFLNSANFAPHALLTLAPPSGYAQCPRTDLSKRFLPKPMTTTP